MQTVDYKMKNEFIQEVNGIKLEYNLSFCMIPKIIFEKLDLAGESIYMRRGETKNHIWYVTHLRFFVFNFLYCPLKNIQNYSVVSENPILKKMLSI